MERISRRRAVPHPPGFPKFHHWVERGQPRFWGGPVCAGPRLSLGNCPGVAGDIASLASPPGSPPCPRTGETSWGLGASPHSAPEQTVCFCPVGCVNRVTAWGVPWEGPGLSACACVIHEPLPVTHLPFPVFPASQFPPCTRLRKPPPTPRLRAPPSLTARWSSLQDQAGLRSGGTAETERPQVYALRQGTCSRDSHSKSSGGRG